MADSSDVSYPNTGSPVVDNLKNEASRTTDELRDLKNSRVTPSTTTATGQPLTHYHSLLYSLLSWEQPRATAVSYASIVGFIFAARYLPLLRWAFKFLYMALGLTAAVELTGQLVLKQGIASSFRPRRYYTIPKETVEAVLEDIEQLGDFFLIEFQRILFAENVIHTIAAFVAAFTGYWLIRFVPLWGLALIAINVAYFAPLVYISNREIIDEQISNAQSIISSQTNQLKDLAGEHTSHATGLMKQYVGDYSSKAQEYIGHRKTASPEMTKAAPVPAKAPEPASEPASEPLVNTQDFPEAPSAEPVTQAVEQPAAEREPLLAV
ncbi:Reticulon [Penicillium riverlandense]|uniref:Reticulon n=1 Tax=Penicillium riverlandense TaxID=1903569 RepID=UPI002546894B|nr:Reticulon [Penicillium riverlandense]KAJ5814555.1 Reticulon [Penicillium riverlandense]